ncbi:zinc finger protein BALDIBIS-like [Gastrolobium bilobum]|uniref:zinc finger protein BALDIBIS-like n=1 Tax=Gastrolobium bilobum TaxID=150636 RepID=UPI002AAF1E7D|nr:zinc finger protein BALDIBIS-like [Gastrolobium bilobum]
MMSEEAFSVPSNTTREGSLLVHVQEPNSNPTSNPAKKKRNLPGTPDPEAEVIALSPKSLMATNRFICEICNKGFQRDQNLQLHRRGHNLPWKLRQRTNKDQVRKKVYVCPEKSCVHHDPCRALGDLTGIKKHFSRKHGEKKWKCNKCSKKYAVQSDWKAHSKICGTREYKCDCGTLFSRKDSFITHRAFCDALAEENVGVTRVPAALCNLRSDHLGNVQLPRFPQIFHGFRSEHGSGSGSEPLGNYADTNNDQKLRLPLWLDQVNFPNKSSAFSLGANSACTMPDLLQTMDMLGSPSQAQWLNHRYPEVLFSSANISLPALPPHGLKQEHEEGFNSNNNLNNVFGCFMGSNNNNIVEVQKFLKQANIDHHQAENLNELMNFEASTNNLGGYSLNDSNNNSCVVVSSTKNVDHVMMMQMGEETTNLPQSIMAKQQLHQTLKNKDHLGFTRDFLGVGDEFNAIESTMNLQSQYGGHYC